VVFLKLSQRYSKSVDNKEQLLAEFYSAIQRDDEDVTTWSNRLPDILDKGLDKGLVNSFCSLV
jgi:hypothetical protein